MAEQLAQFTTEGPIQELQRVNRMGAEIFACMLFPRRYRNPKAILIQRDKERVAEYWKRTKEGIQITTRRDAGNYDPGMHDGKFAAETGYMEREDLWGDLGFDLEEGETVDFEVLKVDPAVLPSAKHALLTIGALSRMANRVPDQLPFIDEFPYEGRRFWGRDMTVATVYEMIDSMNDRVGTSLQHGGLSNYDILPAAQFFQVGNSLATGLLEQILFNKPPTQQGL
jgi:hypothetical protein